MRDFYTLYEAIDIIELGMGVCDLRNLAKYCNINFFELFLFFPKSFPSKLRKNGKRENSLKLFSL